MIVWIFALVVLSFLSFVQMGCSKVTVSTARVFLTLFICGTFTLHLIG